MAAVVAFKTASVRQPMPASGEPCSIDADLVVRHVPFARRAVKAGQHVHRAGQPLHALQLINAGFVKTTIAAEDGRERVTGFHMRGALLGMESVGTATHACDAVALEDGEVWEVRCADLFAACERVPSLQHAFTAALAAEIRAERQWLLALGSLGAEQRVAALLLEFGARLKARGYSGTHFVLRATRAEIGSFLGLQLETVTRAISHMHERGLLHVRRREIDLVDVAGLHALVAAPARVH